MAGTATQTKGTALARSPGASIALNSVTDLEQLAQMLYKGGLTPPGIDSPNKVAAVILAGLEVGLAPTQALGSIMLTNGKLSIYGDGALALVRASGQLEAITEVVEGEGGGRTGKCTIKRKGEPEKFFQFSYGQAEKAGLIERAKGKGPWASYPDRMLVMRARGFALRDVFPDVLRGLITFEEAADLAVIDTEVKVIGTTANPPAAAPAPQQPSPVTAAQLAIISQARDKFLVANSLSGDTDAGRVAWSTEIIKRFDKSSAKNLTAAEADLLIQELARMPAPTVAATQGAVSGPGTLQIASTPPAAVAVASQPAPAPATDGPVTDDQKAKFLELRKLVCAAAGAQDDEARRAAWSAALAPFGATSVAQLTSAKAAEVLEALSKVHDPF